jgi:signal transduction histidine kinase
VAALDGTITVDSPRGAGARVRVELPAAPQAAEPDGLDAVRGAT